MAGLVTASFDGTSFTYYDPIAEDYEVPAGMERALDGTAHYSTAMGTNEGSQFLRWRGIMNSAKYATLLGKLNTSATLVCTYGTCTATLTKISRIETPGFDAVNMGAGEYTVQCDVVFMNTDDGVWT